MTGRGIGLDIRNVRKQFPGGVRAVDGVSLSIARGQFVSFIGPSGCGKSTLLRMLAGLDAPTDGQIVCEKPPARIDPFHRDTAFVFQDAHLLPWRTVLGNVMLPLELMGVARALRRDRAQSLLEQVGLSDAAGRYPSQLSGGMRMRVSLARAMVTTPDLLLLDEPFAALDEITRQQLDGWLRQLWLEHRMTVIFVTHSIAEAAFLSDRAIVFSPRPARVVLDCDLSVRLPSQRDAQLRSSAVFASEMGRLYDALEGGRA